MSNLNLQSRPKRSSEVVHQFVPPDFVLLNRENGYYYNTNKVGAAVWERCDGRTTVDDLMREISIECSIPLRQLHKEVIHFLRVMMQEGLIK